MSRNYIICAAGAGARFRELLGSLPKPLIRLYGRTLLEWSIASLPIFQDDVLVIVTQKQHQVAERMRFVVAALYPFNKISWLEIDSLTRGQLETALLAASLIETTWPIVIFNCDTYFQSRSLLNLMDDSEIEGIVPCVQAEGSAWSFCRVNNESRVLEIREKVRISAWASVGAYYFRDGAKFFARADAALSRSNSTEYYVAPLYQEYIDAGEVVMMDRVSLFKPMGTPDQITQYWNISAATVISDNMAKTIVIDLDNTITIDEPKKAYADKLPNKKVIEKINKYAAAGYQIIIYTARRMQTHRNDEARLIADIGQETLEWLHRHGVTFHGIRFGKPFARGGFYVDDKAVRPSEFLRLDANELDAMLRNEHERLIES